MSKVIIAMVPFTTDELKLADTTATALVDDAFKGAEKWAKFRALAMNGDQIVPGRKQQLAEIYRAKWLKKKAKMLDRELTVEEVILAKKAANADFSRGMRDPDAKPTNKGPQAGQNAAQSGAATGQASPPGDSAVIPPSVARMVEDVMVRVKSIQAEMIQFQANVRVPQQGAAMVGDMAEQLNLLHDQVAAVIDKLSPSK